VILAFVFLIALGKFGITISPFIAVIGAVIFGSTLAFQGALSNYAAGLTIIVTRPFVVGNTIAVKGVNGVVEEVGLGATKLSTEDGE
jgi:small conductance mechanosensitive channel